MSTPISSIIERIAAAGTAYESNQIGTRESLIELSRNLIATLDIPSEFLQRSFWAEHCQHTANMLYKSSCSGKLVLQDREAVITSIQDKEALPFGCDVHDFFTPQPIKAARAYLLHSILHDWDDEAGIRILENLKPALKAGYSRVLLNEIVLSEENPTIAATSMDMMMMARARENRSGVEGDYRQGRLEFCAHLHLSRRRRECYRGGIIVIHNCVG